MAELFAAGSSGAPLADRMRPRTLDEVIGQDHIVGPGRLLRRAIQADRLSSLIFYGPPGTGKTSLARVIANTTRSNFESLNAVLSGIKDIREAIDRSDERQRLYGRRTILFVDEVHRWNKAQQDALLPWVENGTVILVGATTENPFFEVNKALVSRSRIFQLKALTQEALLKTAQCALSDTERGYGKWKLRFEEGALEHLVEVSGGDARSLLYALDLAVVTSGWSLSPDKVPPKNAPNTAEADFSWPPPPGAEILVSLEAAEESIQKRAVLYDRDGDYHFDTISAFIKSVRGSDPDAALYWLAKMVRAGEDPSFIFRRMIILAMEDVGLADPAAIGVVLSCADAFERIGFPEGNFPLSQAALYLATAPKSNTTLAFFDAVKEVEKEDAEVPNHLRDASRDAESFGHGEGYVYPHAYRDHWAAQQYLPAALRGRTFYIPSFIGYEGKIRESVLKKRELQAAMVLGAGDEASGGEVLSWSAASKGREGWFKRAESGRSRLLLSDRDAIFTAAAPGRQSRVLIPLANDGLLVWESLRRSPEGLTAALVDSENAKEALFRFAQTSGLDETEKPEIAVLGGAELLPKDRSLFSAPEFDFLLLREPYRKGFGKNTVPREAFAALGHKAANLLAQGGVLVLLASPPSLGERISRLLETAPAFSETALERLKQAESAFFGKDNTRTWEQNDLIAELEKAGLVVEADFLDQKEERLISEKDLAAWFDTEKSSWGSFMLQNLGSEPFHLIKETLEALTQQGPLIWQWKSLLVRALRA
ncbi:MAG: AAA family ATPase [Spirochaetaceae bacterium]|nr:AAA family ATPase [Spirochaetaceae bacterium]